MSYDPVRHHRRSIRLKGHDYAENGRRVIACPAWGVEDSAFAPGVRTALEGNRMLVLEMRDASGNLAAAEARNRFVIEHADSLFTPYIARGGMLERLLTN